MDSDTTTPSAAPWPEVEGQLAFLWPESTDLRLFLLTRILEGDSVEYLGNGEWLCEDGPLDRHVRLNQ